MKQSNNQTKIAKTRITQATDLKIGDVLFIFEKRQFEKNKTAAHKIPVCNFYRVTVVRNVRTEGGVTYFDTQKFNRLVSDDTQAAFLMELLNTSVIMEGGTYGANARIGDHEEVYRLDDIKDIPQFVYKTPILKNNPAYDLMM